MIDIDDLTRELARCAVDYVITASVIDEAELAAELRARAARWLSGQSPMVRAIAVRLGAMN